MPADHTYWAYILASDKLGTLYVGVTNSLEQRIAEHGAREIAGFTRSYGIERLVFFRGFGEVTEAIHFEKQLKRWRRDWKIRLIEQDNPYWADLYLEMTALPPMHPDIAAALATNNQPTACHPGLGEAQDRDPTLSDALVAPDVAKC